MSWPQLDEQYLTWLYHQIDSVKQTQTYGTYWFLIRQLYTKEFVWIIPNDDNRAEDGKDLRYEFVNEKRIAQEVDSEWMGLGCSMLEMLIGLSRRLSFEAERESRDWFWILLTNINLSRYNDRKGVPHEVVDSILDRVIWRTYTRNGRGGLFPLRRAYEDQRRIELIYQMSAYLQERE